MKTSNKILLGTFSAIAIFLIISNIVVKNEIDRIKKDQKTEMINKIDTLSNDSTSVNIKININ